MGISGIVHQKGFRNGLIPYLSGLYVHKCVKIFCILVENILDLVFQYSCVNWPFITPRRVRHKTGKIFDFFDPVIEVNVNGALIDFSLNYSANIFVGWPGRAKVQKMYLCSVNYNKTRLFFNYITRGLKKHASFF